jgi:agmatine deiminase
MLTDADTNYVYLSGLLAERFLGFYRCFGQLLKDANVPFELLPKTNDIWAKDFMPVQVSAEKFIQFVYNPDYLRRYKKWQRTISNPQAVCSALQLPTRQSNLLLDGGNVIRARNKVILTDKVVVENPSLSKAKPLSELRELFEIETIIIIPRDPLDFTGHADGMVRFVDEDTVLITSVLILFKHFQLVMILFFEIL